MWAWMLLAILPQDLALVDRTELVEVNHFHDEDGRLVFKQLIWWEWDFEKGRYRVADWRLLKDDSMRPQRTFHPAGWLVMLQEGESLRMIHSEIARETKTLYDPELIDRLEWPVEKRRKLSTRRNR